MNIDKRASNLEIVALCENAYALGYWLVSVPRRFEALTTREHRRATGELTIAGTVGELVGDKRVLSYETSQAAKRARAAILTGER